MKKVITDLALSKVFGIIGVVLGISLFSVGSVQAQELNGRMCAISGSFTFSGPLTVEDESHEVSGLAVISACVDENGPVEDVEATVSFGGSGIANCALQSFSLSQLVQWNYGKLDFIALQPAIGDRAPIGAYKGNVSFGESAGNEVITTLFNQQPVSTLSCLLGIEPLGTFSFSGVQIFVDKASDQDI
ncbi:hypothetical protein ACONUD_14380 [Microbulbifer harenosus]|uniref:Secreted protein n=1 Tax=Microbulbifer harenosus TaxID=2576840 RepID=A0ABY2UQ80_9GAMM|nr:hypothetical protein [Microbulbifer harenosus]TLM79174.1 hypothetical protein FDY93_03450 [Microbulbifer harenosus]